MPTETNRDMRAKPETIGRMPRTPDGLSDDAWHDIAAQETAMVAPPKPWQGELDAARQRMNERIAAAAIPEPIEREAWFSWRDWEWSDLWAVAFVGVVLAFAAHVVGWWPA